MADYKQRSSASEYMDSAAAQGPDLSRALEELQYVNRFLGGIRASLKALQKAERSAPKKKLEILDIGTGAADIPAALVGWGRSTGRDVRVVGMDFNPFVCAWAARRVEDLPQVEVVQADVLNPPFDEGAFDYVHCAMFLHHFPQEEAARIVQTMYRLCRRGIIINDLHRHPVAFHAISWCTRLCSKSSMVQHDAPVSVLRGFRFADLEELGRLSGVGQLLIQRYWPFRFVALAAKE
jgi:SAM-dependent methyltransferase